MYTNEKKIMLTSEYFFHTPGETSKTMFLYPTAIGKFDYMKGYSLQRNRYDSFLLLFVEKGNMEILLDNNNYTTQSGQVVILDCYIPHSYSAASDTKTLWIHFDGPYARNYYETIRSSVGNVITPSNFRNMYQKLLDLFKDFKNLDIPSDASMSITILTILQELLDSGKEPAGTLEGIKKATSYIAENFKDKISLEQLAQVAGFSPYYFTRVFKKETGLTPHQYLISTRISAAKYLLSTTNQQIAQIAFGCGFDDVSSFCYTFKKVEKITPSEYRLAGDAESIK